MTCNDCKFFDPPKEACRFEPPVPFLIAGPKGPMVLSAAPAVKADTKACGRCESCVEVGRA